jgi:O-antigen biosynthesis protein
VEDFGTATIHGSGSTTLTTVSSGGREVVSSGGTAVATTVLSNGIQQVIDGTTSLTVVSAFGVQTISGSISGIGIAISTSILNGGFQFVNAGGTASATDVESEAVQSLLGGTAYGTTVFSGGLENIGLGGLDDSAIIRPGGSETVSSGGSAVSTTVSSGGVLQIVLGGSGSNASVEFGGTLDVFAGGTLSEASPLALQGNVIDDGTIFLLPTVSTTFQAPLSGDGTLVVGSMKVTILQPEPNFTGTVGIAGDATVELISGVDFSDVAFMSGDGVLQLDNQTSFTGVVSGFTPGDEVLLNGMFFSSSNSADLLANNVLHIAVGGITYDLQLDPLQDFTGDYFHLTADVNGGTLVSEDTTPCYCRGTLILTDRGEVAIEKLAIGDKVMTLSREAQPVKWIGRRAYDGRFVAGNRAVLPVRIAAGAIADGIPARDLWVSPEHALYVDGALVPARLLLNGTTIEQRAELETIEYFHLEFEAHEVIFAEGMAAESYVDCDNRGMFQNAADFARRYPADARPAWVYCAPRLEAGAAVLQPLRAALSARAGALGYALTADPDLVLIAAGERVRPLAVVGRTYRFELAKTPGPLWLASRSAVPAEVQPGSGDGRRLGVAVERIVLSDPDLRIELGPACGELVDGFHQAEGRHRWTDGMARLPERLLGRFAQELTVEVALADADLRYPQRAEFSRPSRASAGCADYR